MSTKSELRRDWPVRVLVSPRKAGKAAVVAAYGRREEWAVEWVEDMVRRRREDAAERPVGEVPALPDGFRRAVPGPGLAWSLPVDGIAPTVPMNRAQRRAARRRRA